MIFIIAGILVAIIAIGLFVINRTGKTGQATRRRKGAKKTDVFDQKTEAESHQEEVELPIADTDLDLINSLNEGSNEESSEALEAEIKMEYVVLHLMASKEHPYSGYELLQALLANGMRFGDHNIFHRHENKNMHGDVLFSLASVNQPGTFEMSRMGSFSCPGLSLFLSVKDLSDPQYAFKLMLETAYTLCDDLGGEVWGEDKELMTNERINEISALLQKSSVYACL